MDKYEKVKKIGEGSFGKAMLVRSRKDGEYKVVKEISISKMGRKEREDSKKEVSVLAKMRHPNIVAYLESFEDRGSLYIVMEYCDGGDLYKVINRQRGILLDEDKVLDWFVQICLALKHVHDRKILHRDIKSSNIFITRKGMIKLGDFGIAKVLNSTVELARTCIGTPYYLSPEMCENKPYNNKSDIWALGCVLYELCTLKHAFEAGNMKNLVLKIIRGSYPPVSPKYSYELRNLLSALFKRTARDRPSVNTILKKPFLQKRIDQFLSNAQMADEFSHTVLHRNRPALAARPPVQAAAKRPAAPVNPARISDPAAKYGVSLAKKPASGNRGQVRRAAGDRPRPKQQVPCDSKELERKKKEMIEKENIRRERERQMRLGHQQLMEKQRMARIQKAKQEAGWRNLLDSGSSGGSGGGGGGGGGIAANNDNNKQYAKPDISKYDRGNYDHYHRYLDDLQKAKNQAGNNDDQVKGWPDRDAVKRQIQQRPVSASAANAARRAEADSVMGAAAADRAKLVEDFLQRKRQAAMNKARVGAQLGWAAPTPISGQPQARNGNRGGGGDNEMRGRDQAEREYLSRLRQIRLQNFNERRRKEEQMANAGQGVRRSLEGPDLNPDVRKRKIEALRAQADERAAKLKEDLERKRREAYEKEKKAWEEHLAKKGFKAAPAKADRQRPVEKPAVARKPIPVVPKGPAAPVVGLTEAFKNIGIEPESAIEPTVEEPKQEREKSPVQKEKDEILKRLNANRKQWGGQAAGQNPFANMPLEKTASEMEATGVGNVVDKHPDIGGAGDGAPQRKWKAPSNTLLNALKDAPILETVTISRDDDTDSGKAAKETKPITGKTEVISPSKAGGIGETITLDKPHKLPAGTPIGKTVTIKDAPKPAIPAKPTLIKEDDIGEVEETVDLPDDKSKKDESTPTTKDAWGSSAKKDAASSPDKKDGAVSPDKKATTPEDKTTQSAESPQKKEDTQKEDKEEVEGDKKDETKGNEQSPKEKVRKNEDEKDASLMDKVELDSDEEENPVLSKTSGNNSGVVKGLQTGFFDADVRLLRTCSEPDLSKLFKTNLALNPFFEAERMSMDMNLVDIEDGDDDVDNDDKEQQEDETQESSCRSDDDEDDDEDGDESDDEEEDDDDDDDDDMASIRQSYRNILDDDEDDAEVDSPAAKTVIRRSSSETSPEDRTLRRPDSGLSIDKDSTSESRRDGTMDSDSLSPEDGAIGPDPEVVANWDSGSGESDDDEAHSDDDTESVFSQLEESRVQLEEELGCDQFMQAYKSIQAIHEDEDENMEDGIKVIDGILGDENKHLYPKILQLVMADGAFTEDND